MTKIKNFFSALTFYLLILTFLTSCSVNNFSDQAAESVLLQQLSDEQPATTAEPYFKPVDTEPEQGQAIGQVEEQIDEHAEEQTDGQRIEPTDGQERKKETVDVSESEPEDRSASAPLFGESSVNNLYGYYPPDYEYFDVDGITAKIYNEETDSMKITAVYPETISQPVNDAVLTLVMDDIISFKSANGNKGILDIRYKCNVYGGSDASSSDINASASKDEINGSNQNAIVSFVFDSYEVSINGETPVFFRKTLVFDMLGGVSMQISDLFDGDSYKNVIKDYAARELAKLNPHETEAAGKEVSSVFPVDESTLDNAISNTGQSGFSRFTFDESKFYVYLDISENSVFEVAIPLTAFGGGFVANEYINKYFNKENNGGNELAENGTTDDNTLSKSILPGGIEDTKYIAITFDDGPDKDNTPLLLDILKKYNAKATFFVLGHKVEALSDIIQRTLDEGHSIGSHTYNHKQLTTLTKGGVEEQINLTNDLLREYLGQETEIIRPPYGDRNQTVIDVIKDKNMSVILWDIDPEDWRIFNAEKIGKHIINKVKDGDIILMHDTYRTTVEGAEIAIKELTEQGYVFVTVQELIAIKCGEMIVGGVYRSGNGVTNK